MCMCFCFHGCFLCIASLQTELFCAEQQQQQQAGKPACAVFPLTVSSVGAQQGVKKDKEKTAVRKEARERTRNSAFPLCKSAPNACLHLHLWVRGKEGRRSPLRRLIGGECASIRSRVQPDMGFFCVHCKCKLAPIHPRACLGASVRVFCECASSPICTSLWRGVIEWWRTGLNTAGS